MEYAQKSTFRRFARVVLDVSLENVLDYGIPDDLELKRGDPVVVPLRGHPRQGYVIDIKENSSLPKVAAVMERGPGPVITQDLLDLALWISQYYLTPLYQVFQIILPSSVRHSMAKEQYAVSLAKTKEEVRKLCIELRPSSLSQARVLEVMLSIKKNILLTELQERAHVSKSPIETLEKKGILFLEKVRLFRSPLAQDEYFPTLPKVLGEEQKKSLHEIQENLREEKFRTFLLHGVTGSGKTEVYLQSIEQALALNKGTIMLVPEISLTVQTIERFRSRFEGHIAILHHKLSDGERYDEWTRICHHEAKIVIGARSAIFSPVHNLGLIIIDEEHDPAYKQTDKMPCYHARDTAVMRGKMTNSTVILGSATPSLESYYNAKRGKYHLLSLPKRVSHAPLASIHLIDMNKEFEKNRGYTLLSERLFDGIKKRLCLGEQTILFLNRRGTHTTCFCERCGFIYKCPQCDLTLTFHFDENCLSCHLCAYTLRPAPKRCDSCGSQENMKYKGIGTELVERSLHALFPGVRTLRIDADTTRHKGSYENLFRNFRTGKSDILIGTQMIAKGLHFPSVTLVAILNCDGALHIPDFRSSESVFQLITQVAGRAGRGELPGEVIIQTRIPDNTTIKIGLTQDFENFFGSEIAIREAFRFPPFTHFVKFIFEGESDQKTQECASQFRYELTARIYAKFGKVYTIHPLVPAGHPKIKNIYRFQFLLRGSARNGLQEEITHFRKSFMMPKEMRLTIDVDPFSTFF